MEIVAMDMKLRGMYMTRQLSFAGVTFDIKELPLTKDFIDMYDASVKLRHGSRARATTTKSPQHGGHTLEISSRLWLTPAYIFDIGHPCHGQLTAVKTRYPLTSIT
ncbi:protein strawberry notch homolog 1-like [Oculina patagonica]